MKIAVLGSAGSLAKAPFQNAQFRAWQENKAQAIMKAHDQIDGEFDIWGCSPGCWSVAPRATRWFEVHRWETGVPWFSPEYVQFLRDFKGPVYTGGTVPEIQNHVVYPLDYIEAEFSSYFLNSSLSLMLALAIDTIDQVRKQRRLYRAQLEGNATPGLTIPTHMSREQFEAEMVKPDSDDIIGLWGVDMAATEEYAYQRPGCQFFVLEAGRRGIGVYLPPESDLMRPQPVYGISEWDHNYIKLTHRARELNNLAMQMSAQIDEGRLKQAGLQGELHALNYFVSTWTSPYGMQHGLVNRQDPGTGLGSGITHYDGRPVSRMTLGEKPIIEAMIAPPDPDAHAGRGLIEILGPQQAPGDGDVFQTVRRIIHERDAAINAMYERAAADVARTAKPAPKAKRRR